MKNLFLVFLVFTYISFFFTNCSVLKKKQSTSNPVLHNYLVLDSLVCIDLSENLKGLSSGDDEILLITRITNEDKSIYSAIQGFTVFSKKHITEKIGHRIPIHEIRPNPQLVIILLEQDTDRKNHELANIVDTSNAFIAFPKIDKVLLRKELGDDDLLDIKVIALEEVENHKSRKTKLRGIHLFDEFEYWLYWHLE